jgi:hypothetical protein
LVAPHRGLAIEALQEREHREESRLPFLGYLRLEAFLGDDAGFKAPTDIEGSPGMAFRDAGAVPALDFGLDDLETLRIG